jgi:hypothetical protein
MPTRIDEIESEVELESESTQGGDGRTTPRSPGQALDHFRDLSDRTARDEERTRAWDFDD